MTADHGIAEQQLQEAETALRKGVGVFVSGPPGSGRQVVLQALEARFPAALVLDLRSLRDADAPAVAVLEARAALSLSDEAVLDQDGLFEGARQIATLLDRADRLLVLRVPGDWWRIARADGAHADALDLPYVRQRRHHKTSSHAHGRTGAAPGQSPIGRMRKPVRGGVKPSMPAARDGRARSR